jgi:hypothetical protein
VLSRKICEATGDCLSDTPADPELNDNNSCTYNFAGNYSGKTDPWGDHYETPPVGSLVPDTRNIMNYNRIRACRIIFSRLQIAVMVHSLYRGKNTANFFTWSDLKGEYDEYEMDNFSQTARPITFGEIQERNFNQQYNGDGVWGQCDVDWVRFVAPCNNSFSITTSAILNKTNANTRLTLFNNALVQLAQNDNISATNLYSSINWNFVAGQQYFIRVENMVTNVTGYYNLQAGNILQIIGDAILCATSNPYTIPGLLSMSSVVWTASPTNLATINSPNALQTTLTKVVNATGSITLKASVTNACTASPIIITKQVNIGKPTGSISFQRLGTTCYYQAVFNTNQTSGTYEWSDDGVNYTSTPTNVYGEYLPAPGNNIPVWARITNFCGNAIFQKNFTIQTIPGSCNYLVTPPPGGGETSRSSIKKKTKENLLAKENQLEVYPNPTTQNWTIAANSSLTKKGNAKLFDVSGRIIWQQSFTDLSGKGILVPGSNLAKGIYLLHLEIEGIVQIHKLIKM